MSGLRLRGLWDGGKQKGGLRIAKILQRFKNLKVFLRKPPFNVCVKKVKSLKLEGYSYGNN